MSLDKRHVVVTGGTGALGRAVVRILVDRGAMCHVPTRSPDSGRAASSDRVDIVTGVNVTDESSVRGFYRSLPGLWASIHCAGGFAMSSLEETSAEAFDAMMALNARSAFLCCREAVGAMRRASTGGGPAAGRIVNVAAMPGIEPGRGAGMAAYTASKAAVAALTEALAEELVAEEIRVNAVAPSILDTEANRAAMPGADHARWPRPDEVAAVIALLASPEGSAARGSIVKVYGRA